MTLMDEKLFQEILSIDSSSGQEDALCALLEERLRPCAERLESWPVPEGGRNILLSWGTPRLVFCTHLDTVPPYIAPRFLPDRVSGRGSCDAKGQVIAMLGAARELAEEGLSDFGVLLVSGEETGSWGAKAFAKLPFRAPWLVVGEPTDGKMVSASKGTKAFELSFAGEPFHSGYPECGRSAVDMFVDFMQELRSAQFGIDPILGQTSFNVGRLHSDNPQNILSPRLDCRIYFRTTFASDAAVTEWMMRPRAGISVKAIGGDAPARYDTVPGIPTTVVAFGSDAPHLSNFEHKMICGPGSIKVAHRDDEYILKADIESAVQTYISIYKHLNNR